MGKPRTYETDDRAVNVCLRPEDLPIVDEVILSTPHHPHTDRSAISSYDGYPGGVGLSKTGYDRIEPLMGDTRELLGDCPCEDGCPACVQSPYCGNANEPLDKDLARQLLTQLLAEQ